MLCNKFQNFYQLLSTIGSSVFVSVRKPFFLNRLFVHHLYSLTFFRSLCSPNFFFSLDKYTLISCPHHRFTSTILDVNLSHNLLFLVSILKSNAGMKVF